MADTSNIRSGPDAFVFATEAQRRTIVDLWRRGCGIRVWSFNPMPGAIGYELETVDVFGVILMDGTYSEDQEVES